MGPHATELDRLLRLAASGSMDLAEVKEYRRANRAEINKELDEFWEAFQPPGEEGCAEWAKRWNAAGRRFESALSNKEN